ncbi:hypothetical protein BDZ91DRAFT_711416 [Kalaharituber pfeilii]|nr:hypothetical protein BDZ91DRAFT_711416 [Kalaharituber pfeilii]
MLIVQLGRRIFLRAVRPGLCALSLFSSCSPSWLTWMFVSSPVTRCTPPPSPQSRTTPWHRFSVPPPQNSLSAYHLAVALCPFDGPQCGQGWE